MAEDLENSPLLLPLVAERAVVQKETVETGRVTIHTHVEERFEIIREALRHEHVTVDRVPIGLEVESAPAIRQEGETLIYPIMEEEIVVTKRLILKEELRITRVVSTELVDRDIALRSVRAEIHRT